MTALMDVRLLARLITQPGWHMVNWGYYPNGEPMLRHDALPEPPRTLCLRSSQLNDFMVTMLLFDSLREQGYRTPSLILPCVPGARQDRLNKEGDCLFTLKTVANMLNQREIPWVTTFDPHSDVTPALIERMAVFSAADVIRAHGPAILETDYDGVIAPDAGAGKRALGVAQLLGVPLFQAWKQRSVDTGALRGFRCEPLQPGRYLVVDDICDGGATFIGLADEIGLTSPNTTLDLYVTHGYFSRGTEVLLERFEKIYTTDTVLGPKPDCTVIPVCGAYK